MAVLAAHTTRLIRLAGLILCTAAPIAICAFASGDPGDGKPDFLEYDIKAAYLVNFAKFVEWPEEAFPEPDSPFKIGVLGKNPFGDTLAQLARDQTHGEHKIELQQSEDASEMTDCHIVFVAAPEPSGDSPDLSAFSDKPVLTVGEQEDFAENGGIINFVIQETKVKFEISLKEADLVRLKLSPRLLKLAIKVYE